MARIIYPNGDIMINMSSKKEQEPNIATSTAQLKKDQEEVINRALDQTREDIRKSVDEVRERYHATQEQSTNIRSKLLKLLESWQTTLLFHRKKSLILFNLHGLHT